MAWGNNRRTNSGVMTANEMSPAIGAQVTVRFEQITIEMKVLDVKHVYGEPRLLVQPVSGNGEQWITLGRLVRNSASLAVTA